MSVEAANRVGGIRVGPVLDEREAARSAGLAIGTDVHADEASGSGENFGELLFSRAEAQIADENLGRNDALLLCVVFDRLS